MCGGYKYSTTGGQISGNIVEGLFVFILVILNISIYRASMIKSCNSFVYMKAIVYVSMFYKQLLVKESYLTSIYRWH